MRAGKTIPKEGKKTKIGIGRVELTKIKQEIAKTTTVNTNKEAETRKHRRCKWKL